MLRRPLVRRLLPGVIVAATLATAGTGTALAAPSLTAAPPPPVAVTTAVPFETTVLVFSDTEPGPLPGDRGWVEQLYLDVLGRPLDTNHWVEQLGAGASRRQVAETIVRTDEWRVRTASTWWTRTLGRTPADLQAWADALAGRWTVEQARAVLLASEEHRSRVGGSDDAFLDALFRDALGRPIDPQALAVFRGVLAFGIPHQRVAEFVLTSDEARQRRAAELVAQLLRRPPSAEEVGRHAATIATFGEAAAVVSIVTGDEYDRLQPTTYRATVSVAGGPDVPARVIRRLDGAFAVVAPISVATPGGHTARVVVTRNTGQQLVVDVPVTATRARNETYLDAVAQELLGRPLAPDQLATELARMPAGGARTRAQVALRMVLSDEGRQRVVATLYRELLGREAVASETAFWAGRIQAGSVMAVRALLLGSDEVVAQSGGTDAGWIDTVYRRVLGRPAEPQALEGWLAQRRSGLPRPFVAYAILQSQEARQRVAAGWAQEVLGRAPTPEEALLGEILAGIPAFELGYPALLLGGDRFYTSQTGVPG